MTASTSNLTLPTPEQLKAYAEQLPEIYCEILAAFQFADPNRQYGDGVLDSTLKNYLRGRSMPVDLARDREYRDRRHQHRAHLRQIRSDEVKHKMLSDETVSLAIDKLASAGLIVPPVETRLGSLIPTPLGEALIETVTGVPAPVVTVPDLPKPTW